MQTEAVKPVLGRYYRETQKSGALPIIHIFGVLLRSLRVDHFVSDHGDVVYHQAEDHAFNDGGSNDGTQPIRTSN